MLSTLVLVDLRTHGAPCPVYLSQTGCWDGVRAYPWDYDVLLHPSFTIDETVNAYTLSQACKNKDPPF